MLALQIQQMIDDDELAASAAAAGRELIVNRYGFERVTKQLESLYRG